MTGHTCCNIRSKRNSEKGGRGGYKALDTHPNRLVALKLYGDRSATQSAKRFGRKLDCFRLSILNRYDLRIASHDANDVIA